MWRIVGLKGDFFALQIIEDECSTVESTMLWMENVLKARIAYGEWRLPVRSYVELTCWSDRLFIYYLLVCARDKNRLLSAFIGHERS